MEIRFSFVTKTDNLLDPVFQIFIEKGMNSILKLKRFDYKEPLKKQLDKNNIKEVKPLFDYYSDLILKGDKGCSISVHSVNKGLTFWTGHFTFKRNSKTDIFEIINLIEFFANDDIILFGSICREEEYSLKHKIKTDFSYGWKGTSISSFMTYLPGIYWYTIFGKELVESIGRDKFKNFPNVIYTEPESGSIAFHLDEPIDAEDLEKRIAKEKELAKIIGQNYFFDKDGNIESFGHPKQFAEFLKSLEK